MYWIPGNSRNILEFLRRPKVTGHYKKIPLLYLRKNLLSTAGNLKVNEQTKYESVPIFLLFLAVERNSTLGVKIDTSYINFLQFLILFCKILNHLRKKKIQMEGFIADLTPW